MPVSGVKNEIEESVIMAKRFDLCIFAGLLCLALSNGLAWVPGSYAQQDDEAAIVVDQFMKTVIQGDSPAAFELCTSGLKRGKTAEDFLSSPEIQKIFSGVREWQIQKVLGRGSIRTVVLKLVNKEGEVESLRALGVACLKMRGSYRVRDFSTTPWAGSEARYLRYLSDLYIRLKDMESAEQAITQAYSLDPKDPKVSAFIGYVYLENEGNLEEAKALIQAAHDQAPDDPEFMDFLGWYYHKANQRQESVQWFDKAREAFKEMESYQTSPEYIRFSNHVNKAKASGWRPTQT
jgi:tetratricopeptide (TPR) repeat protein